MRSFLIIYDRHIGTVMMRVYQPEEAQEAHAQWHRDQRRCLGDGRTEVVLLHSDSFASLIRTHGKYFMD